MPSILTSEDVRRFQRQARMLEEGLGIVRAPTRDHPELWRWLKLTSTRDLWQPSIGDCAIPVSPVLECSSGPMAGVRGPQEQGPPKGEAR